MGEEKTRRVLIERSWADDEDLRLSLERLTTKMDLGLYRILKRTLWHIFENRAIILMTAIPIEDSKRSQTQTQNEANSADHQKTE